MSVGMSAEDYAAWRIENADSTEGELHPHSLWARSPSQQKGAPKGFCVCGARSCYGGWYCTRIDCPAGGSLEGHDLVWAIQEGNLLDALRLFLMMYPHESAQAFADWIIGLDPLGGGMSGRT